MDEVDVKAVLHKNAIGRSMISVDLLQKYNTPISRSRAEAMYQQVSKDLGMTFLQYFHDVNGNFHMSFFMRADQAAALWDWLQDGGIPVEMDKGTSINDLGMGNRTRIPSDGRGGALSAQNYFTQLLEGKLPNRLARDGDDKPSLGR